MPDWKDIPLIMPPNESVDDIQVDQSAATIVDAVPVLVEGQVQLVKRPGLTDYIDLGTNAPIDGLYWFDRGRAVIAVSAGRVWKITDALGTHVELLGSTDILSNAPVRFVSDATRVFMANGGKMVYTDLSTLTTMADPDAPVNVTHLAMVDQFILANVSGSGKVQFSDVNNLTSWQALSFFTAESSADDVVAIGDAYQEILVLGRETCEFWIDDGQSPFSRIPGTSQPFGTEAPYSLALAGDAWIWLDHKRRLVTMQGHQIVPVSTPYDRVIQRYQAVDNAIGYVTSVDSMPIYVLNFPTAGETLAYNYVTQHWHKWGYWDADHIQYDRFRGNSYCYARSWNQHLVGDHTNGKIYKMSRLTYTDSGNPIRSMLRTGHLSHGAMFTKQSDCVRLRCKRGVGNDAVADPQISMRRRVDGGAWNNERWASLGQSGDSRPFIEWRRNGIYRTCQYEFVHSDNSDLVVMGAQEYLTPLGS